jgi:hypothetical protein
MINDDAKSLRRCISAMYRSINDPIAPLAPTMLPQRIYDELMERYPGYANNPMIQPAKRLPSV